MSMSDSLFHGTTKINQNIQNAPGGQAVQCETCSAKQTTQERNGANTDLAARVRAGEREREGEIDAASRTSPLRIRTSSSAGYPITAGDSWPPILCIFIAHSRSQTDAHFVSNEYISTAAQLSPWFHRPLLQCLVLCKEQRVKWGSGPRRSTRKGTGARASRIRIIWGPRSPNESHKLICKSAPLCVERECACAERGYKKAAPPIHVTRFPTHNHTLETRKRSRRYSCMYVERNFFVRRVKFLRRTTQGWQLIISGRRIPFQLSTPLTHFKLFRLDRFVNFWYKLSASMLGNLHHYMFWSMGCSEN